MDAQLFMSRVSSHYTAGPSSRKLSFSRYQCHAANSRPARVSMARTQARCAIFVSQPVVRAASTLVTAASQQDLNPDATPDEEEAEELFDAEEEEGDDADDTSAGSIPLQDVDASDAVYDTDQPVALRSDVEPYNDLFTENSFSLFRKADVDPNVPPAPYNMNDDEWDEYDKKWQDDPNWENTRHGGWVKEVTDWSEFWNHQTWDLQASDVDEEVDAEQRGAMRLRKAEALIEAIRDTKYRTDMIHWLPPAEQVDHSDPWEDPPMEPERPNMYPKLSAFDARAIAEKNYKKQLLNHEWERRKALIGLHTPYYTNIKIDERLERFEYQYRRDWTEEEIYNLITLDGINCKPEDYVAIIENPLLSCDYTELGVEHIEETEDLLIRTGHMASREMHVQFQKEVTLTEDHLVAEALDEIFGTQAAMQVESGQDEYADYDDDDEGEAEDDD